MICAGCLLWGVMTVAFSQCNSVMQGYIFWGKLQMSYGELHERPGDLAALHWSKHGGAVSLHVLKQNATRFLNLG